LQRNAAAAAGVVNDLASIPKAAWSRTPLEFGGNFQLIDY